MEGAGNREGGGGTREGAGARSSWLSSNQTCSSRGRAQGGDARDRRREEGGGTQGGLAGWTELGQPNTGVESCGPQGRREKG